MEDLLGLKLKCKVCHDLKKGAFFSSSEKEVGWIEMEKNRQWVEVETGLPG